jgi:HEPN domain-containing protein
MKSSNYTIWLKKACSNLTIAKHKFINDDIFLDDLCYNCNQAAERVLKGFLIFLNKKPPRTNDILVLAQELSIYITIPENIFTIIQLLKRYDIEITYPNDTIILKDDYERACAAAVECVTWVISEIKKIMQQQLNLDS